ncbi:hypothetical protein CsSME_00053994 [Camellia sinensis var. sinensis]|uniref:Uncharacterized protein n=1 Tax=Camellia sinensis TaxID=4442 RepID=A0A7J7G3I7_CAMSI|nr:hypothetical protein HYC85_030339 [Camellia sinensis]
MAIDMCSETPSLGTSPRISFSHDLHVSDHEIPTENSPSRSDSSLLDSNSDFNFFVGDHIQTTEQSSADELFSGGLIRPMQFVVTNSQQIPISKPKSVAIANANANANLLPPLPTPMTNSETESKTQSKTFWKVKRSSSLRCDNSNKKSSFWSLPQLLRSNSTGSVPNSKSTSHNHHQKQNSQKQHKNFASKSSSSSSSSSLQKPPLKKNYGGGYGNGGGGVRISPVLNVPPPYISRGTTNLFGLGSLFRNGKDPKKNKKSSFT